MKIKLKKKYIDQIKQKYTTYSLGKKIGVRLAVEVFNGNANMTLKNFCKLCKAMDWNLPEQIKIEKDN